MHLFKRIGIAAALSLGMALSVGATSAIAQDGGADGANSADVDLPPVEVIQEPPAQTTTVKKKKKKKTAKKKKYKKKAKKKASSAPPPPPPTTTDDDFDGEPAFVDTAPAAPANPNSVYGASGSTGASARAQQGAVSPANGAQLTPTNLEGFSSSATNVSPEQLENRRAANNNEVFTRVPGLIVTNDDGNAHHGGLGVRGSPPRRSRKVLMMEDGHAVNLALWLDPSSHFTPPIERIESVEVVRGTIISHGPNNNYGVINLRNLSPFGPSESVISAAVGFVDNGRSDIQGASWRRHVHTRQMFNNVGVVLSYTGADVEGAWDSETLRFHDFYTAIGFKGSNQDLTVAFSYSRQRDNYDESNLEAEDGEPGDPERQFFQLGHNKLGFAAGALANNYNGDIHRVQATHNLYLNQDTTITTRAYAANHTRDRYQIISLEDNPAEVEDDEAGLRAVFEDGDDGLFNVLIPEDSMFGRLRNFRHIGIDVRGELANLPLFAGMTHDIQAGVRYEYQDMKNRNFIGLSGDLMEIGDKQGLTIFDRNLQADTFSAFLQSTVHASSNFTVTPGVRFEWYKVDRQSNVTAEEEGEAEELEGAEAAECAEIEPGLDECLEIEGIRRDTFSESYSSFNVLPGVSFAYSGFNKTTLYAGYHRGQSTAVLRNEDFPAPDEIGNNFQIGLRSMAITGLTFEIAGFHSRLKDFQFGQSFSAAGDRGFGRADEVHINGFEVYSRLDSQRLTGGEWNLFGEANYTYAKGTFKSGQSGRAVGDEDDEDAEVVATSIAGNRIPEVPIHVAALTLGVEQKPLGGWAWDASATYTYRGAFFTDEFETPFGGDGEGEKGEVPSIWLLSARANLQIADTGASVWVSGNNLTNELYITDREDGLKPGLGRSFWAGAKVKF